MEDNMQRNGEYEPFTAEVKEDGRITIPKAIRSYQGIETGDTIRGFIKKLPNKEEE